MPQLKCYHVVQDCTKIKFKFFKTPREIKIGFISWGVQHIKGKKGFDNFWFELSRLQEIRILFKVNKVINRAAAVHQ